MRELPLTEPNKKSVAAGFWLFFVSLMIIILTMFTRDKPLSSRMSQLKSDEKNRQVFFYIEKLTHLGEAQYFLIPLGAGVLAGIITRQKKLRTFFIYAFLSVALSGLLVDLIKLIIGRHRPEMAANFNPFLFKPFFGFKYAWASMPSGHSATAAAAAAVFLFIKSKFKYFIFLPAIAIASTRVILAVHFLSDAIAGFIIGCVVSLVLYHWFYHKGNETAFHTG
jgi:membrane-associated phospholipid phosphatase